MRFGNSGRDIVRGPGLFNVDASVFREFVLREWLKMQFRAESYSLTNTPQFGNPGATVGSTSLGIISSLTGDRQIRLALKLSF